MRHVIESQQFSLELLDALFLLADQLEKRPDGSMAGRIMASLFYEPSTRTRFSFESAMYRLGGSVITTENAREFSSAAKGETLEDSIRVIGNYADVIVIRHHEEGAARRAAAVSSVPIINGGDGPGQHPTQALLDLYTIRREQRAINGIRIAMVGDLKHGRTVRSLAYLLGKYKDIRVVFVSPAELRIGEDIKEYLRRREIEFQEADTLASVISDVDVVYQTRVQTERFERPTDFEKFKSSYRLDGELLSRTRPGAIIMHPLPRTDEIRPEVDASPKAVYFKQARYGVSIRMAILKHVLGGAD